MLITLLTDLSQFSFLSFLRFSHKMMPFLFSHAMDYGFTNSSMAPLSISLSSFTPTPLPSTWCLSCSFVQPSHPVSSIKQLSSVPLQGRLVNAEEASLAWTIGGGLSSEQVMAWELFNPIQRFLIAAIIGVVVAECQKNHHIWQLKKSMKQRVSLFHLLQSFSLVDII